MSIQTRPRADHTESAAELSDGAAARAESESPADEPWAEPLDAFPGQTGQLELPLRSARRAPLSPAYPEIAEAGELRDPEGVLGALDGIDWAFADERTGFLSHDVHPYPAKFIPQIPGNLIARLSLPGELVLDPFGGSGTTALEAVRLGRRALSIDANPVAELIGRVKTTRLTPAARAAIAQLRATVDREASAARAEPATQPTEQLARYIPDIPNIDKWFAVVARRELAMVRQAIAEIDEPAARDVALVALSRIVLKASFQDSETRYASRPRAMAAGDVLARFASALDRIATSVAETASALGQGAARFQTMDSRELTGAGCDDASVDLVVTSPPYGNSYDYHLYHRFRLFWLGFDPRALGKIEIGSHLRHQKEKSGFPSYIADMERCVQGMSRVLKSGRYAALVVGDPVYRGTTHHSGEALRAVAERVGMQWVGSFERPVHATRRAVVAAGQRATSERIVLLRQPPTKLALRLHPPRYRLQPYEEELRLRETRALLGLRGARQPGTWRARLDPYRASAARQLTFTRAIESSAGRAPTWQDILESGPGSSSSAGKRTARKSSKYVTHGLHPYKGKFYPQLAKGLLNAAGVPRGAVVFDPFCGSGTTLLECRLNGFRARGCDLHPLAAKIARAKVGILDIEPAVARRAAAALIAALDKPPRRLRRGIRAFPDPARDEIERWFPTPVIDKLAWLMGEIRAVSGGPGAAIVRDYLEVILSSIIREVSQQDPRDLRIRRRKEAIADADVLGLFAGRLADELSRLEHFWSVRAFCPQTVFPARVAAGDARELATAKALALEPGSVDLVLTSPPYATALPYIDTDRLSLLVLFGLTGSDRRPLEMGLTGSREITKTARTELERVLTRRGAGRGGDGQPDALPAPVVKHIRGLYRAMEKADDIGFRRRNVPALLVRFFGDMQRVFGNLERVLRKGGQAMVVAGDNHTTVGGKQRPIPTSDFLALIAESVGLPEVERIPITVTTENLKHIRHAITENVVLRLRKPGR